MVPANLKFIYDAARSFLLPRVNARLLIACILLSLVGDVGESLPDLSVVDVSED